MFVVPEGVARVLVRERMRETECRGEIRTWCSQEFRAGIRHG